MLVEDCFSQVSNNLRHIFANSGRSIFRIGNYEDCLMLENFKYSLLKFGMSKT